MEDRINAGSLIGDSVSALMVPSISPPAPPSGSDPLPGIYAPVSVAPPYAPIDMYPPIGVTPPPSYSTPWMDPAYMAMMMSPPAPPAPPTMGMGGLIDPMSQMFGPPPMPGGTASGGGMPSGGGEPTGGSEGGPPMVTMPGYDPPYVAPPPPPIDMYTPPMPPSPPTGGMPGMPGSQYGLHIEASSDDESGDLTRGETSYLDLVGSFGPVAAGATVEWDFSYDGTFDADSEASGTSVEHVYADWLGDGDFVEIDRADWVMNSATQSIDLTHFYDDSGTFDAVIRLEDEAGLASDIAATVAVANVIPTGTFEFGTYFTKTPRPGFETWGLPKDGVLRFTGVIDPSKADRESLKYYWIFDGQESVTDEPEFAPENVSPRVIHHVSAFVLDKDQSADPAEVARVRAAATSYRVASLAGARFGSQQGFHGIYGDVAFDGETDPYNRFGYEPLMFRQNVAVGGHTIGFNLDDEGQALDQSVGVRLNYLVSVVRSGSLIWYHDYMNVPSGTFISATLEANDVLHVEVQTFQVGDSQITGFILEAEAVQEPSWYETLGQYAGTIRTLANTFAEKGTALFNTAVNDPVALFDNLIGGIKTAVRGAANDLMSGGLTGAFFSWLVPGSSSGRPGRSGRRQRAGGVRAAGGGAGLGLAALHGGGGLGRGQRRGPDGLRGAVRRLRHERPRQPRHLPPRPAEQGELAGVRRREGADRLAEHRPDHLGRDREGGGGGQGGDPRHRRPGGGQVRPRRGRGEGSVPGPRLAGGQLRPTGRADPGLRQQPRRPDRGEPGQVRREPKGKHAGSGRPWSGTRPPRGASRPWPVERGESPTSWSEIRLASYATSPGVCLRECLRFEGDRASRIRFALPQHVLLLLR